MAKRARRNNSVWKVFKFLIITAMIAGIVGVLGQRLYSFLTQADLFKIRVVAVEPSLKSMNINTGSLEKLKGRNIFKVNLWSMQKELRNQYPTIDQLRLIRHFPDKIFVVAAHRTPFALIENRGYNIIVDRNGIVMSSSLLPNLKLPVIRGTQLNTQAAIGRVLNEREVSTALEIIRSVQTNEDLKKLPLLSIDVSNLSSISFELSNQMKIIIDDEKIYPKIRRLGILLTDTTINLKDYRYIDLRFNEPVLGKNDQPIK